MRGFSRITALVIGLLAIFAGATGSASATSWHNTGGTTFTGTGVAFTMTANGVSLTCTGQSWTGTAPASSAGPTYAVTGDATFTGCRWGGTNYGWTCNYTFTGTRWTAPNTTNGVLAIRCSFLAGCTLSGTVAGVTYANGTPAVLNLPANNTLGVGGSGCILGVGAASMTAWRITTTSANPPVIVQP
jgi:hypothetical protein